MGRSELFSYLSAFVTIVLAVALTDIIQSTHRLIRARRRVRWDGRPLLFAVIVTLGVVSEFFSLWSNLAVREVSMPGLLWLLATPTVFALLAYSALPDEVPEDGIDLALFFDGERRVWAILYALAVLFDFGRALVQTISYRADVPAFLTHFAQFAIPNLLGSAMLGLSRDRRWQWLGLLILLATCFHGELDWSIRATAG